MEIKKCSDRYIIEENDVVLAEIDFVFNDENDIVIEHTIVSETLKGQGIGNKLVKRVIEFAREEKRKIIPHCAYAKKVLTENKEYEDVLKICK